MIKNLTGLILLIFLFASCGNNTKNTWAENEDNKSAIEEPVVLTVATFTQEAPNYIGKEIQIQGLVSHTCKHGGKRMFIIDEETEESVKIEAGENITSFDAELEGSDVLVTGIINELVIDEAYLIEWEEEIQNEMAEAENEGEGEQEEEHNGEHSSGGLGEKADMGEHVSGLEKIENFRKQIEESDKDYLAFYSVECLSYEVIPLEEGE